MASKKGESVYVMEARGLAKEYRGQRVVDDFAMHVQPGDIYGFVGKNGAGKSTVMKMIDGLVRPTAGEVLLFGAPADTGTAELEATGAAVGDAARGSRAATDGRQRLGALIEALGLLPSLGAYDNLMAKALAPVGRCPRPARRRPYRRPR